MLGVLLEALTVTADGVLAPTAERACVDPVCMQTTCTIFAAATLLGYHSQNTLALLQAIKALNSRVQLLVCTQPLR